MRLVFLALPVFLFFGFYANAQQGQIDTLIIKYIPPEDTIKYWDLDVNFALSLQHINFHNWSKGGNPSVSFASGLNLIAVWEKDNKIFSNQCDIGYGLIREGNSTRNFRKNDDFFIYIGKFGKNIFNKWYLEAILDFRTQFSKSYKYNNDGEKTAWISDFFSPAYIRPSFGLSYKKKNFSFTGSPISGKMTIVLDDSLTQIKGNGVKPNQHFKSEVGASLVITDKRDLMKNVSIRYNFLLFSNYDTFFNYFPDVNGEVYLRFKVNKYISSTFNFKTIYDNAITMPKKDDNGEEIGRFTPLQLNYTLSIGFSIDLWSED